MRHQILDYGYIEVIEHWGSDRRIIEAARMSTNKGFLGWGPRCTKCAELDVDEPCETCAVAEAQTRKHGDEKLLKFLYDNNHATPFEMAGAIIEVKAPIFVFREWVRHRTQGFNEMSARYTPLPDENYCPTVERIISGSASTSNKQAQGVTALNEEKIQAWLDSLQESYRVAQKCYEDGLAAGIPKELARLPVPVARYSRMRATANLRNWLGFLTLRNHPKAQEEIRVYAEALTILLSDLFPRTLDLWKNQQTM
jgi:thymidylate synthase (FAD)